MKTGHTRQHRIPFRWPVPPLQVVLVEPEIPPNTGNIARLCAATGSRLHLVEPLGFRLTDAALKRAGLDYWDSVDIHTHQNYEIFKEQCAPPRILLFSTGGQTSYLDIRYAPGDALVFGGESRGLPESLLKTAPRLRQRGHLPEATWKDSVIGIPMRTDHVRSLNLATAVGIVLYEALRQLQG